MDIATLFGMAVCLMLLLTWASDDHVRQKLGLLLLGAWAASNLAVNYMGVGNAPLVIPSLDALVAIVVAVVGYSARSRIALIIFAIYAFVGAVHVVALVMRAEMTYNYYAALNVLFACQLITLGASSAWVAFHRWAGWSGKRLRPHLARR